MLLETPPNDKRDLERASGLLREAMTLLKSVSEHRGADIATEAQSLFGVVRKTWIDVDRLRRRLPEKPTRVDQGCLLALVRHLAKPRWNPSEREACAHALSRALKDAVFGDEGQRERAIESLVQFAGNPEPTFPYPESRETHKPQSPEQKRDADIFDWDFVMACAPKDLYATFMAQYMKHLSLAIHGTPKESAEALNFMRDICHPSRDDEESHPAP